MSSKETAARGTVSSEELVARLAGEFSQLVRAELELAVAERGSELRRLALEAAATLAAAAAGLLACLGLSLAAAEALAHVLPDWAAALCVAAFWALAALAAARLDHPRALLRRLAVETGTDGESRTRTRRREAEDALTQTAERLGGALAREAAERELHAPLDGAERLVRVSETEADALLKELLVAFLAPGKAGLSLLELLAGRRGREQR